MSERKYFTRLHLPILAKSEIFDLLDERDRIIDDRISEELEVVDTSFRYPWFTIGAIRRQEEEFFDDLIDDILDSCGI